MPSSPQSPTPPSSWPPAAPSTTAPDFAGVLEAPTKTSGLAIASLVLGIAGLVTCGVGSVVGLILGIISLGSTIGNPPQRRGKGIAIAGIVVSSLTFFVGIGAVMTGLMLPAVAKARGAAHEAKTIYQLKNVAQAQRMYAASNGDSFAPPAGWATAVSSYSPTPVGANSIWSGEAAAERTITMNSGLARKRLSDIPAPFKTVLLFETMAGSPASGGLDLLPSNPYSREGYMVAFVDGSVRLVPEHEIEVLIWEP